MTPADVDVVVCTLNSAASVERCLSSLKAANVGSITVVDANSTDGTRDIAGKLADRVLDDPGIGLGNARNIGIAATTKPLILNLGSDNIVPPGQLERMISTLIEGSHAGVSARTRIEGASYLAFGLNTWREGRFRPGAANVIGTPTLFRGDLLRDHPYDPTARFSDDSELCERWHRELGATFAISDAVVVEAGKTSWEEIRVRARMYGISDNEVYSRGTRAGWSTTRRLRSLAHPARVDLLEPIAHVSPATGIAAAPFLAAFTALRYAGWGQRAWQTRGRADR